MKGKIFYLLIAATLFASCAKKKDYKDPSLPIEERVEILLKKMTLEEKVAQLYSVWLLKKNSGYLGGIMDTTGKIYIDSLNKYFPNGLGNVVGIDYYDREPSEVARIYNELQRYFIEKTRLGIPALFYTEALHGLVAKNGTSYPMPIALGCSFNPEMVEDIFTRVAEEVRANGPHVVLSPVLDLGLEPRWGRIEEGYGEDPYLTSVMAKHAIWGFQGREGKPDKKRVISTMKHFAAHGRPEYGFNCSPGNFPERILRNTHLYPFEIGTKEGKALSVMSSYNEIDGIPSSANKWLLTDVLRNEWKFEGIVVSDFGSIKFLHKWLKVAENEEEAAKLAITAGVDVELPRNDCYQHLVKLVKEGKVDEKLIDRSVRRVLRLKFMLGLFENPYIDEARANEIVGNPKNNELALKSAEECIVMLKNANNILPLDVTKYKTIAVIGPNAKERLLGGYSGKPRYYVSLYDGIMKYAEEHGLKVNYARGCNITNEDPNTDVNILSPLDEATELKLISEAVAVAKNSDVIILSIGENMLTGREAMTNRAPGDRSDLNLIGYQQLLVDKIVELGKPVVVCLTNGRPNSISKLSKMPVAILECWYLGQETGNAIANVIFGKTNPSGKLCVSIPRSVGHLPAFYNKKNHHPNNFIFSDSSNALYPFGYGLSYTTFEYSDIKIEKPEIKISDLRNKGIKVSINVKNTGSYNGKEIVQLYISDLFSSTSRPIKELKDFRKIELKKGEEKTVEFVLTWDKFAFYNIDKKFTVEKGDFVIYIGSSSDEKDLKKVELKVL